MNEHLTERRESRDLPSGFHPLVYKAAIGLVVLFVVAAWAAFDRQSDIELPLAILSILLFVAVLLTYLLWRIWRKSQARLPTLKTNTGFLRWAKGSIKVGQGELKGADAAIDMP